ncbi:GNAT family N-acetyltransferase [Amycolatopsis coloradensis]|uniref:GNAT family N-acetyltransferase n=1 Tax=Amycolatopsis coloradensis TaxID=76021 RepID=A0A1R0KNM3_9PSEU|nr:GNAT family N-acetyltransferase [Amycolatopsis coloradensis]OLZ48369.1 GNAT family N-acetyltransferase [Amycolatopsis coloradensis]
MNNPPEIKTARLRLRGLTEADTEAIVGLFADPALSAHFAAPLTEPDKIREMVGRRLAYSGPAGTGHWAIERDGEVIGLAHLRPSQELPGGVPEIGYYLARAHGGQGLATEAASALLDHGLLGLGLSSVWALVGESNVASLNLVRRLGFLEVGGGDHYGGPHRVLVALPSEHGQAHHIELWVPDLARAEESWGWLLGELGWREFRRWPAGVSWKHGATYLVVERSPALSGEKHERTAPGLNHLALHVDTRDRVNELASEALEHGWSALFADKYPYAGGDRHYAAYLENADGFEVELVARPGSDVTQLG